MDCLSHCKVAGRRFSPAALAARRSVAVLLAVTVGFVSAESAWAKIRVVTTTPGYADIVHQIGGSHVSVHSVMRGPEDPHHVSPRPSQMMKVKRADLFVHSGLDLEVWAGLLAKGSRNKNVLAGQPGNIDVSRGVKLKEVPPRGSLSRALGDIHVFGNPHYALDPLNGVIIARTIADALKRVDPKHGGEFDQNYQAYAKRLRDLTERLVAKMAPYRGTKVVIYHRSWPYFRDRFGLRKAIEVEPKPGITPGPQHLAACVEKMKEEDVEIVILATYNNKKDAETIARRAGGKAVVLAQEVRGFPEVKTYEQLFEYDVDQLIKAFREVGIRPESASLTKSSAAENGRTPSSESE